MRVNLRLWGGLAVFIATIMVSSGGGLAFITQSAPGSAAPASPHAPPLILPKVTSGSLPEFPTNLTHFIYIVRENHVFDDYLGDCALDMNKSCDGGTAYNSTTSGTKTETAPSGDQLLTPNLHSLGRQYVTFDNMYSSIDPYSAQAHAYLFSANSWGSTDSCAPGGVEGTGSTTEWGIYNSSSVKAGSCAWASDSGSQSYDSTGGSIFDRFLGSNVPQSKTTIPFLSDGDIIWELSSPGCSSSSQTTIPGDTQKSLEYVTGCTNGWWMNTTSGSPDMPPTVNTATGIPQMLWECQYACSGIAPNPFLDSYASNSFLSYVSDYGLPTYSFVELFDDHPGNNCGAGQPTCIKENDAAMGQIVNSIMNNSAYKSNTVIAVTEDDTQNGQNDMDHVNSGRRFPFVLIAPHTVEKQGGPTSACGISSAYGSCAYMVHQTFNTSNVLAVMERVEMNVNPSVFNLGGVSPTSNMFPMVQNDYLAEGNPLEPVWLCSGPHAAYCNTGTSSTNVTLSGLTVAPASFTVGTSSPQSLTATPSCTGGACPAGITYAWSVAPTSLGTLSATTGATVTFTSGTSAGTGTIYVNATYNGVTKGATSAVTVTSAPVTLASVAISPTGPVGVTPSGTSTFSASATSNTGSSLTSSTTFNWSLSNTALGSLSSPTGTSVTFTAGTSLGNLSICVNGTYSGTTKGPACSTISITNAPPALTSVTITPSTSQILGEGATVSYTAQALDQFGNNYPATYTWSVSTSTLGTFNASTGKTVIFTAGTTPGATGTVTVTATNGPQQPPTASDSVSIFGATATESTSGGAAPLSVSFTGTAAGGTSPYSYNWNFGDGNTSTSQNPSHQYTCPGSFQPSLTVTDASGHSSTVSLSTISVTGSCGSGTLVTAKATGTPLTGSVPLTCDFTGSASGGTAPYTFSWNFGDGGTGTGQSLTHTYYSTGTFTVGLNVTDSAGHRSAPYTLTVTVNPAPTTGHLAIAIAASPSNGSAPLAVTFAAAVSGGSGTYTSFTWNFGDGGTGAGQYITHNYATARNQPYNVELTVTDSAGNVGHQYANITVNSGSSSQQSSPGGTPWWFWLMVLVVVILAVVIVAMVVRGRKAKSNSYPGPYDTSTAPTEFPPGNFQTYPPGPGAPPPHQ